MQPLRGIGVLVTRPEPQAQPLCRRLEAAGATTLSLPVTEIVATDEPHTWAADTGAGATHDLIVFTSINAVRFGASLLRQHPHLTVAAIGPATARALNDAGYTVAIQPQENFDSGALLLHPSLQRIEGRRILLIKGVGGRPLLAEELTRRGARVQALDVYRRVPAPIDPSAIVSLQRSFAAGAVQVITATSLEIAGHLLQLANPRLREEFEQTHWLLPGARIAAGLRERGVKAPFVLAASAQDQDLVAALVRWRSSASGA